MDGVTYVAGDVTDLPAAKLGAFDFYLDIGCSQGFNGEQRQAEGHGVTDRLDLEGLFATGCGDCHGARSFP